MNDTVLNEAERYSFPILILNENEAACNSAARKTRSMPRSLRLSSFPKKTRETLLHIGDRKAVVASCRSKGRKAVAFSYLEHLIFMYIPMLDDVVDTPNEPFSLEVSGNNLPELLSCLGAELFPKSGIKVSSFARICSACLTLAFSEDAVKQELDGDGVISAERAFYVFGEALNGIGRNDLYELSEPPIEISFSEGTLTVSRYGFEEWSEKCLAVTAVTPYSFTEQEYFAAFILALAISIFKSRK